MTYTIVMQTFGTIYGLAEHMEERGHTFVELPLFPEPDCSLAYVLQVEAAVQDHKPDLVVIEPMAGIMRPLIIQETERMQTVLEVAAYTNELRLRIPDTPLAVYTIITDDGALYRLRENLGRDKVLSHNEYMPLELADTLEAIVSQSSR